MFLYGTKSKLNLSCPVCEASVVKQAFENEEYEMFTYSYHLSASCLARLPGYKAVDIQ